MMNIAITFWTLFTVMFVLTFTVGGLTTHFSLPKKGKGKTSKLLRKASTSRKRLKKAA